MTRRFTRGNPNPPPRPPKDLKAANMRLRGNPPPDTQISEPIPEDLESGIIRNWDLSTPNINTCIPPEHWPRNEPDPRRWHMDIVHLLHEASTIKLQERGVILCSNNEFFRQNLAGEIGARQRRNKSKQGTVPWMTATDLKVVIKKLWYMIEDNKEVEAKDEQKDEKKVNQERSARRGGSKTTATAVVNSGSDQNNHAIPNQQEEATNAPRGRGRPKKTSSHAAKVVKPEQNRQASDLPIRPARRVRGIPSKEEDSNTKPADPPPITPANPPENSDDDEDDQENAPPEPVSGRHIYGDLIKPTTLSFNPETEPTAVARPRRTRKRGRADNEKPPAEVQIDSDPRDIDATGFLSELDPKEMRRRRKPRLSRLQQDRVTEPPWSQDVPAPPETPLTPATDGRPAAQPSSPVHHASASEASDAGLRLLVGVLPSIPECATSDERRMLEDRAALIHRDITTYKAEVLRISGRGEHHQD